LNPHQRDVNEIWGAGQTRALQDWKIMKEFKGTDGAELGLILGVSAGGPGIGHVNNPHAFETKKFYV
jgi:hypothetical protein